MTCLRFQNLCATILVISVCDFFMCTCDFLHTCDISCETMLAIYHKYSKSKSQVFQEQIASIPSKNRKYVKVESATSMSQYTFDIFASRKYCILGEHEFSREHPQQVNTYSVHVAYRVRNRVGPSPVRISKRLILISHVGLMIH